MAPTRIVFFSSIEFTVFFRVLLMLSYCVFWCEDMQAQQFSKIQNVNSNKFLAVPNASTERGVQLIQWDSNNQPDILWELQDAGNNTIKIKNRNSGLYMAVASGAVNNGAEVIQWPDEGQRDLIWQLVPTPTNTYRIKNINSSRFLAIGGGSTDNGGVVTIWDNNGQRDIEWRLLSGGTRSTTSFNPQTHGFKFVNDFIVECGTPLVRFTGSNTPFVCRL